MHLLHLRARWYAPGTGIFLSVDPVESEPPYQYVRGNVVNRTDASGNSPECQDDCEPVSSQGFLTDKARITCFEVKTAGGIRNYLHNENDAALLTRVALAEGESGNRLDRRKIMWVGRLRMEIAYSNNLAQKGDTTTLKEELFAPNQFSSLTGHSGQRGMVEVNDPQDEAKNGPARCGSQLNLALYPCDDEGNINDPESEHLKEWKETYLEAVRILYTPGNMLKYKYPLDLQPQLTDGKWIVKESFLGNGETNFYNSTTSHDEEWIWGMSDCDPWNSENPKGCKTYVQ